MRWLKLCVLGFWFEQQAQEHSRSSNLFTWVARHFQRRATLFFRRNFMTLPFDSWHNGRIARSALSKLCGEDNIQPKKRFYADAAAAFGAENTSHSRLENGR